MLLVSREATQFGKDGNLDKLTMELIKTNSVIDIAEALAERLIAERDMPKKIVVSKEEMDLLTSIFRVRGVMEDGTAEYRGRKRKDSNPTLL